MEVAPFRALTLYINDHLIFSHNFCRNGGRPFQGIDTFLTRNFHDLECSCRNGGRPFQGIDTVFPLVFLSFLALVEMKVAPFRA